MELTPWDTVLGLYKPYNDILRSKISNVIENLFLLSTKSVLKKTSKENLYIYNFIPHKIENRTYKKLVDYK